MKTNILICIFLILFVFKVFGQSNEQAISEYQKLENVFVKDEIPSFQLEVFEQRSVQKLNDFAAYMEYISDKSINEKFRMHAKDLALKLFVNPDATFIFHQDKKTIKSSVKKYLNQLLSQKEGKIEFEFIDISQVSKSKILEDGSYSWTIKYIEKQSKKGDLSSRVQINLKISLKKTEKKFGSKVKWIWEVFLDEMKSLDVMP